MSTTHNYTTRDPDKSSVDTVLNAVQQYREKGYVRPIPTRLDEAKTPKISGCHGRVKPVAEQNRIAAEWWENNRQPCNIALVMVTDRTDFEIISIDVDHHDDKHGRDRIEELEKDLGSLELDTLIRSTRRDSDRGGQFLFKVPEGIWWPAQVCEDVEVRSQGNSYSTVWPSMKDGLQYKWRNSADEQMEIPCVDDLPTLPEPWVKFLSRGSSPEHLNKVTETVESLEAAYSRLRGLVEGFNAPAVDTLADSVGKVDFGGGAQPAMNAEVWHLVNWCVFDGGPVGLGAALDALQAAYVEELTSRPRGANRRGRQTAELEFARSVAGAVDRASAEIAGGRVPSKVKGEIAEKLAGVDLTTAAGTEELEKAHEDWQEGIDRTIRWKSPAAAVARLIAALRLELVTIRVSEESDKILNSVDGKILKSGDMREILEDVVKPEISRYRSRFEEDSDEDKAAAAVQSEVNGLYKSANLKPLFENSANAIRETGRVFNAEKLNMNPYLIGVGSEILDLKEVMSNPEGDLLDWLRPARYEDAVTKSIPVDIRAGLKSLEHREKSPLTGETYTETLIKAIHPDDETRRFVQKALGYSMFGQNKQHKFYVWYGPGGSGKGSLAECVLSTLGEDYVSELTPEQFKKGSASKPDPDYADSLGTRTTFVNETSEGMTIDAAAIKRGTETRKARPLYSNDTVKYDGNTITVMTNRAFVFDHDTGVARRLAVIPFRQSEENIQDAQPGEEVAWRERDEERVWFLRWLLEGFAMAMDEGLKTKDYPPEVANATREFIEEADPSTRFFNRLRRTGDEEDFVSSTELILAYRVTTAETVAERADKSVSMKLSRWFKDQGHEGDKKRPGKERGYVGWVIDPED